MKVLNLTRETLAGQLKMHSNTVGNALRGGNINRNSADRLVAFAHGEAKEEQPMIAVSPYAVEVFQRLAREMKVSPDVWCTGFAAWFDRQDRRFQNFVQDSVADAIRSMALPARTETHPAKGMNESSGKKGPFHANNLT